jgi:2'-5' RNA ligase
VELAGPTGGRALSAANLHLTVGFIGMIDRARLAALRAVGELARAGVAPFRLRLDRIGRFARARVAWAGVSVLPPELQRLHDELGEGCRSAGSSCCTPSPPRRGWPIAPPMPLSSVRPRGADAAQA